MNLGAKYKKDAILSFPFDGGGWFAGDVVGDAVYAGDLVHDAVGDCTQNLIRQVDPVGSHEVGGLDGSDDDDLSRIIRPAIAHNTDARDREQNSKDLAGGTIQTGGADFIEQNFVGQAEFFQTWGNNFTNNPDG